MGIFSPRQSACTPPFDGTNPRTTLVGQAANEPSAGSGANDNGTTQPQAGSLPARDDSGDWKIEMRRLPLFRHDPAYEIGGDGGQIQNSNSVAYTLGRAMGLDLDRALRNAGAERRFSGWRATC